MNTKPKDNLSKQNPLNMTLGGIFIALGILILMFEYQVFERPNLGWGLILCIIGLFAISSYFTTRPEPKAAELGTFTFCLGLFFILRKVIVMDPWCTGFCWEGLFITIGISSLLAATITKGKAGSIMSGTILISIGAFFLLRNNPYYFQTYSFAGREWIILGTTILIIVGISMIAKAFKSNGNKSDEN